MSLSEQRPPTVKMPPTVKKAPYDGFYRRINWNGAPFWHTLLPCSSIAIQKADDLKLASHG